MAVRFDGNNVLLSTYDNSPMINGKSFEFVNNDPNYDKNKGKGYHGHDIGKWFNVQAGRKYPVEMFISMGEGGFGCGLMIEEKNPPAPYEPSEWQWQSNQGKQYQKGDELKTPFILLRYPLFALKKGVPIVPFTIPKSDPIDPKSPQYKIDQWRVEGRHFDNPDVAQEPMIFPGAK
jgi:hypothetical protein